MAEKRIKGITIEIGGDTKKLSEALKDVNKTINSTNTEIKDLQKALKLDPKNTELLAQKQELLEKQIKATTDRLNTLKDAQKQMGDYNSLTDEQKENYRALSVEISKAESSLKSLNDELKSTNKFDLSKLNDSLSGVREKTTQLVKDFAKFGIALGGTLSALGISSVKAYANYEQLVGGVEKLFGDSSKEILQYAQNGYKTAGISANQYMEVATSFSASLIRGLEGDTRKAATLTDRAIKDMSDNANTFGSSMEEISNVYKALSKEQYTTLDNLRLGYAGTKKGMQDLIKDASKYTDIQKRLGITVDESSLSFDNIINAISVMQDHLGIAGTTAKEAEHTISGSVNQMKSSWDNLLVSVSDDNADMGKAVDNFIDSVITAGKNIVPRIRIAIDGIKKLFNSLVRDVFPKLKKEIPELAPIINVFEWFIDHKQLFLTAMKTIIGAFVVTKIVDFGTKVQTAFQNLMNFAKGSTIGAITTGIAAIAAVVTTLSNIFDNETEAQKQARLELEKITGEIDGQIDSWNNLQEAQQNQINAGMSGLGYYEKLYDELKNITDENGNVKEGNEERAEFIVNTLSDALGIEIDKEKSLADKIKGVSKNIDEVMNKKKADIILDSQKGMYEEALKNEAEASQRLNTIEDNLNKTKAESQEMEQKLIEHIKKRTEEAEKQGDVYVKNIDAEARYMESEIDRLKEQEKMYQDSYNKQEDMLEKYIYNKNIYETNMALAHAGKTDEMIMANWEYVKSFEDTENAEKAMLEDEIRTNEKYLSTLKKMKSDNNTDMYDDDIKYYEKKLAALKDDLKKYVSAFEDKKDDMKTAGANLIQGATDGMNSKKGFAFSTITGIATAMLSKFKASLKEQSPSKATRQMGEYLLDGLSLGIKDNEHSLLNQVDDLGNSVISNLYDNTMNAMNGLGSAMKTSLNPTINPSIAYDMNYKLMANAMKEALQDVDVELDDRKVGKFINKTVSEEVFN